MKVFHRKKIKGVVVKIIRKLNVESMSSIEKPELKFSERMQELLRSRKVIASCDASIKNGLMVPRWVMMKRDKEELINHQM